MACGFWLRVNSNWVPIPGVRSGVGVAAERAVSSFVSVGGVAHSQAARRAVRSWQVSLGELAGPESVAALMMAAQQVEGEVMLWDESAARANLLDPVQVGAREGYPVMLCDGMPTVSLTSASGGTAPTVTKDVQLKANVAVVSDGTTWPHVTTRISLEDSILKTSVPLPPEGMTLTAASLVLRLRRGGGALTAHAASNAWAESEGATGYWTSVPAGAAVGSAPIDPVTSIPLSGVAAFAGADMSLRLVQTAGTFAEFWSRLAVEDVPVLRLTYSVPLRDRTIRQHLRAGSYWLTYWTNAAAGTEVGTLAAAGASLPLITGAGSGLRQISVDLSTVTSTADRDWTITINDSSAYLLGGLMLTNMPATGYLPGHKTPVRVRVEDPSLVLDSLYAGEQGMGQRAVVLREDG